MKKVCIIGGGASGLFAAIFAARNGSRVTIFESNDEPGKKLTKTGNGKCNFTNAELNEGKYVSDSSDFVKLILEKFSREELFFFLSQLGLLIKEKNGYFYPYNEQALMVKNLLVAECKSLGVKINCSCFVNYIEKTEDGFLISVEGKKERELFDRVIVATGTKASLSSKERENGEKLLSHFSLDYKKNLPGLTKLNCSGNFFDSIKGVRSSARVKLFIESKEQYAEDGEILFHEQGVSGIVIFNISNFCSEALARKENVSLSIDLMPEFDKESLVTMLRTTSLLNQEKTLEEFFFGIINNKLADAIFNMLQIDKHQILGNTDFEIISKFIDTAKGLMVKVIDTASVNASQVCLGGVYTYELTEYLEAKKVPGLFVTGELINVTGLCGGYNLQWAFSTGAIAGEHSCY